MSCYGSLYLTERRAVRKQYIGVLGYLKEFALGLVLLGEVECPEAVHGLGPGRSVDTEAVHLDLLVLQIFPVCDKISWLGRSVRRILQGRLER